MLYVGLDDTDMPGTRGTGHLARQVAAWLGDTYGYGVTGITRHQLLYDRRIPYTANNSSNVIGLDVPESERQSIFEGVAAFVRPQCPEGSDPGLCVAMPGQAENLSHGKRCQIEIVPLEDALNAAQSRDILLTSLAGSPCGMIGALAGVCLRASGDDGRYIHIGTIRELKGRVSYYDILDAGVDRVRTEDGREISSGYIETHDKLRPALRDGLATLFVRQVEDDLWESIKL